MFRILGLGVLWLWTSGFDLEGSELSDFGGLYRICSEGFMGFCRVVQGSQWFIRFSKCSFGFFALGGGSGTSMGVLLERGQNPPAKVPGIEKPLDLVVFLFLHNCL